jgi:hypothetical protein
MRMRDKEYLQQLSYNRNQLSYNQDLLDGLVRRFILLCRQDVVAIAAGAPSTLEKREELQDVTWKAIAQAAEYSKSEEPEFKPLIIRNYEPPDHLLYTVAAGQTHLSDPFGV